MAAPLAPGSDTPARVRARPGRRGGERRRVAGGRGRAGDAGRARRRRRAGRGAVGALRGRRRRRGCAVDPSVPTGTCVVLVAPGGERSMLPDAGANAALAPPTSRRRVRARRASAPVRLRAAARRARRGGRARGARAAPGRAGHDRVASTRRRRRRSRRSGRDGSSALAGGVDLLLPNRDEALVLAGDDDPRGGGARARGARPRGRRHARRARRGVDGRAGAARRRRRPAGRSSTPPAPATRSPPGFLAGVAARAPLRQDALAAANALAARAIALASATVQEGRKRV